MIASNSDRPVVWALLDTPPRMHYPNGFSPRWFHFLNSLSDVDLDVLSIRCTGADWQPEDFLSPELSIRNHWSIAVPDNRLNGPGLGGKARRLAHYAFASDAYMSHPRTLDTLGTLLEKGRPDLVVIFLPYLGHLAFQLPGEVKCIFVLEEGWDRALEWSSSNLAKPLRDFVKKTESARVKRLYTRLGHRGHSFVVISEKEKEWFGRYMPAERVRVIPHGVDCDIVHPQPVVEDIDVAVIGDFGTGRNAEEAASLFHVLDSRSSRTLKWAFVGREPPQYLASLGSERVLVTGFVDDVRPYFARSKLVVAPSKRGTGVKTVGLMTWAMGRPLVATSFSAYGIPAKDGWNVLIGNSNAELAGHAEALLADPGLRAKLARNGLNTVREQRDMKILGLQFAAICAGALDEQTVNPSS